MRRFALTAVVACALVAGAGLWWLRRVPVAVATEPGRADGGALADLPIPRCALRVGDRFALAAEASVATSLDLGRLLQGMGGKGSGSTGLGASPAQRVRETRRFALDLEVLEEGPTGSTLGARVRDLAGSTEGGEARGLAEPGVEEPFRIRLDGRCAISAFGWRKEAPLEGARQQQSLVAPLGFSLPRPGDGPRYPSEGFDATGTYRALNQLVPGALLSRVTRYERVFGEEPQAAGPPSRVRVERALLHVQLEEGRWLAQADRTLSLRYLMGPVVVGSVDLEARFRPAPPAAPPGLAQGGEWEWGHLFDRPSVAAAAAPAPPEPGVSRLGLEGVLSEVSRLLRAEGSNPADYVVLLADWLRAHPEALPGLLERLKTNGFQSQPRLQAALFHALAAANTPQTRAALNTVFEGRDFPYGRRVDAAQVMCLLSPPPDGFLESLVRESEQGTDAFGRGSMQLALGMLAAEQAKENPALAARARAALERGLERASDEGALVHALQAAGNAGSDALHPAVASRLGDGRVAVREAAAHALRGFSGELAHPGVEERLAREQDPAVRARLLDAALTVARREGKPPPASLLQRASREAETTSVAATFARAVELLGVSAETGSTQARGELERLFAQERARGSAKDPERLQALGRYVQTRWTAP